MGARGSGPTAPTARRAAATSFTSVQFLGVLVNGLAFACITLHAVDVLGCEAAPSLECSGGPAHVVVRFWGLDHLPGGQNISYAYGGSGAGDVIVGESFSSISQLHGEGAIWRRVSPQTWAVSGLGMPADDALNSPAAGVSSNGHWVVGRASFGPPTSSTLDTDAYRWDSASGYERLGVPDGFVLAAATATSAGGEVVVGYGGPSRGYADLRALLWSNRVNGWAVRLLEAQYHSAALRSDSSGRYVVGWGRSQAAEAANGAQGREAVLWSIEAQGQPRRIWLGASPNSDYYSMPLGVERVRSRIAVFGFTGSGDPMLPAVWTLEPGAPPRLEELPLPPGFTSGVAAGMSRDGRRVVGNCWGEPSGASEISVCIWDDRVVSTMQDRLSAAGVSSADGWTLWGIAGVSADGTLIFGSGTDPSGEDRPWVAELH